ncbi:hypothetical protein HPB48_005829 [Haemaphysalis longicornis]|uniref:Uncharacterized protein n=1 Tax=Haemaphysalis longicornis TaxID=44386 RepID=A0A9J6GMX1_HAELO|nr:hypothetical protein HPB48_005829 [Haemaphysalis longicornis]
MDRDEYYKLDDMTNAEQHELLREASTGKTTPSAPSVTGLLHRTRPVAARRSSSGLPCTSTTCTATRQQQPPTTRVRHLCEHRKGGCGSGRNPWCTRLSSSLSETTGPNET